MDSSEITAIIALVVSLIALLIALLQLLQSSALSAEGWCRCNQTVIGRWSVFSRRKWLSSELRFEVKFTTPVIRILDGKDAGNMESESEFEIEFVTLESVKRLPNSPKSTKTYVFKYGTEFGHPEARAARKAMHILGFCTLPNSMERAWELTLNPDSPKYTSVSDIACEPKPASVMTTSMLSISRWLRNCHFRWQRPHRSDYNTAITWELLLVALYQQQVDIISNRNDIGNSLKIASQRKHLTGSSNPGHDPELQPDNKEAQFEDKLRIGDSLVCVELERQSWDFLPTDVTRPLAISNLRTVVILARRLGMRWKIFDRAADRYHAEGNNSSLSATSLRGLGLVFRFNSRRQPEPNQRLIWSSNADKAYFGIIASDRKFIAEDYTAVGSDCRVDANTFICKELGDLPLRMKKSESHLGRIVWNDFVALVSPFMPLECCRRSDMFSPAPSGNRSDLVRSLSLFKVFSFDDNLREKLNEKLRSFLFHITSDTTKNEIFPKLEILNENDILHQAFMRRNETKVVSSSKQASNNKEESEARQITRQEKVELLRKRHIMSTLFF